MKSLALCFILTAFLKWANGNDKSDYVVSIEFGEIRGSIMSSAFGREFLAFRGIPYAKAPIGDLRFKVWLFACQHCLTSGREDASNPEKT